MAACLNKFPLSWASNYASWLARWELLLAIQWLWKRLTLGFIVENWCNFVNTFLVCFFPNQDRKLPTHHQKLFLAMVRTINPDFQLAIPETPKESVRLTRSMSNSSVGNASAELDAFPSVPMLDLAIMDIQDQDKLAQDPFLSVSCPGFPVIFFPSLVIAIAANYR